MIRGPIVVLLLALAGCARDPAARGEPPAHSAPVVLFVGPDSARIEELRARDEDAFYTMADDEMWYRSEAYPVLDSLRLRYQVVDRAPMRFAVDGRTRRYTWDDVELEWFVVLYDGGGEPRVTASVDLPAALAPPAGPDRHP